ncbi:phosphocholine-specific phospholipase C [Komagataeibacter rhaeticus]|uniref:phospholipase C n=1 Tax=Komagataeibacter rhaeticus TaxID=215221 RepID=A0A181C9H1_9PROT|nr:phospholipase C, phosphocholine-specific [Komagataeibacter rhaeticus]QIP35037.1 phospholipase C, phosphocholine-specific [Komagataeibacter rhaeticus]QOC47591.1 phospholipase C, phosphocholine-specific [Komagataeibacter rhaeticus]SAY48188.1 Non-hemolytic phospholipase C precursor [Komagataeibacter rhaeticus]
MTTRRNFLKYALMSGAAASAARLPASISRAFAIAPEMGSTWRDAEHVVILMQENRSFDHVFGTLQGVRGFHDPRAMRLPDGNPVFAQGSRSGETYLPWRLNIHDTRVTWMGSVPHSRDSQVDAWNGGGHDGWIDAKKSYHKDYAHYPLTMGHYTREDLPFYYALADAFTVCDQNYCGAMTSTTPNRLMFWTGTVRDRQDPASRVYMRNGEILEGGMNWTTFPERLEQAGVSWKFYQNELSQTGGMSRDERAWLSNFGCNVLECFDRYHITANPGFGTWLEERISECQNHIDRLNSHELLVSQTHAEQLAEAHALLAVLMRRRASAGETPEELTPAERSLFEKAFVTNRGDRHYRKLEKLKFHDGRKTIHMKAPRGDILHQFRKDVKTGRLPTVSWLAAPEHFSDHPTSPWYGAWYVSEIMDILTDNPEVWKKTIFIMTYDENDGYFDHCCSYAAPDPRRPETGCSSRSIGQPGLEYTTAQDETDRGVPEHLARSGPIGLGFRVPMIVASPWSRGGWVNSQLFEHTSTLRFLEAFVQDKFGKDVTEHNISPWRRAISGDLTSCFRPYDGTVPRLPFLGRDAYLRTIEKTRDRPLPGGFSALDVTQVAALRNDPAGLRAVLTQEAGTRPACALPYEPYCDGGLSGDGRRVAIRLRAGNTRFGARAAGVPFNIYRHGTGAGGGMQAGTYAVAAGDVLDTAFARTHSASGRYDVDVHAPNGFYRRYRGMYGGLRLQVECRYLCGPGQDLVVRVSNHGARAAGLTCTLALSGMARSVQVAPGHVAELPFDLALGLLWYDISLTCAHEPEFLYQFAGRIETGQPGRTDPVMGGVPSAGSGPRPAA